MASFFYFFNEENRKPQPCFTEYANQIDLMRKKLETYVSLKPAIFSDVNQPELLHLSWYLTALDCGVLTIAAYP
ncbi:hypothetical protein ALQ04_200009 [Pseudomonas cichorii]|uniref:Uncharacterized protein n=1 Tax=Pseudomonas cichorii TaxID=36746 RepID=A0A3M4LIT8_PSECI|nr:hypothetical protein ALQ04_200009 [Pseudomonas cichorii]